MRHYTLITTSLVAACALALSACGGGGGTTTTSTEVNYTAAAAAGELVSYTLDTSNLTYAYRIEESAYGLTGQTGSGTLTKNADGTYTPSGAEGKIAVLESGLMLGSVSIDTNGDGTKEQVPLIGAAQTITSVAEAEGVYNFISRQCDSSNNCTNNYGTVKVQADGSWQSCGGGNLAVDAYSCPNGGATGTTDGFASGRAVVSVGGINAGSMFIFKDATTGQKALFLDLNGKSALGAGAIFAATQSLPSNSDGTWHYSHSGYGLSGQVKVSGMQYTDTYRDSSDINKEYQDTGSLNLNQPWTGFVRVSNANNTNNDLVMLTGSGMYAGYHPSLGTISVGVRP